MLQAILPLYNDPLLCELFFRNYAKHKQAHIDRLVLVVSSPYSMCMQPTDVEYIKNNENLLRLLKKYDIRCDKIVYTQYSSGHGVMFHDVLDEIRDEKYHCFFDEQDAYWINNNFEEHVSMLDSIDLIGGEKAHYQKFDTKKFNQRYNVHHDESRPLYKLHLPEFLSNRAIKNVKDFDASYRHNVKPEECGLDGISNAVDILFDTFQHINLQVYKTTDKTKLYLDGENIGLGPLNQGAAWGVKHAIYIKEHEENKSILDINLDDKIVYHVGESGYFVQNTLGKPRTLDYIHQRYVDPPHPGLKQWSYLKFIYILNLNFFYQALKRLDDFQYKDVYQKNYDLMASEMDLNRYDCSKILDRIL